MKIVQKIGAVFSLACVGAILWIGATEISRAQAAENAVFAEEQRVLNEIQAQRIVSEFGKDQVQCLAQNIFFEARDQSVEGQVAVAWVTMNRVDAKRYPDTICGVVRQANKDSKGNVIRHKCQFSWYCDGKSDRIPKNSIAQRAWEDAQLIARVVLLDYARGLTSPVQQATMYHADYVSPNWMDDYDQVAVIGEHIFYQ